MPKKVLLMLTVMLSFCFALPGGAAMGASAADGQSAALTNADKRLLIDYQLPFEGAVAPQAGTVALDVLIENPGEGFEGRLQILRDHPVQGQTLLFEQAIVLKGQQSAAFPATVPLTGEESFIIRVLREGQEPVETRLVIPELGSDPRMFILSDNDTAYHFLHGLGQQWRNVAIERAMDPGQLPDVHHQISADLLAIANISSSTFTDEQIEALHQYVQTGGILMLSGGKSFLPLAKRFDALLPLEVDKQTVSHDLSDWGDMLAGIPQESVELLTGTPKTGAQFFPNEELPLFVGHQVGSGFVILALFDVTQEPLASWSNNARLWEDMLAEYQIFSLMYRQMHGQGFDAWEESKQIPGMASPSVPFAALIWIVYVIVVGPLLYLILKRMDRREWAWGIIPIITFVTAASIYYISLDRIGQQTSSHTVSDIYIHDQHLAEVNSQASFFVLEGNEYDVELRKEAVVVATEPFYYGSRNKQYVRKEDDNVVLRYEQVPYMSLTYANAISYREDIGYIEHELYVRDDRLQGTLTNHTSFDLENISLKLGPWAYEVGHLDEGSSRQVDIPLEKIFIPRPNMSERDAYVPEVPVWERDVWTEYESVDRLSARLGYLSSLTLHAESRDDLELFSIQGKEEHRYVQNHIRQSLRLSAAPQGSMIYPYGFLPLEISAVDGEVYEDEWGFMLGNGAVEFKLWTHAPGFKPQRIEVPVDEHAFAFIDIELWNITEEKWERVSKDQALILEEEDFSHYADGDGRLTLRMSHDDGEYHELVYPFFKVEGEMN